MAVSVFTPWQEKSPTNLIVDTVDFVGYVNEPCTTRGTNEFRESGPCSYWADSKGTIVVGSTHT